jgi:NAD(P)-dependent dehydrogenase (short-subunit alcohol dehydrogenase family)
MATQALAVNGAKVYIVGRTKEKLDTVVKTYNKDIEGEIIAVQGDVTSKDDIARLAKDIESREGSLDILVNNAGVSGGTVSTESKSAGEMKQNLFDAEGSTFEDWTSTYQTNVAANYFVTAAFLPLLQKSSDSKHGWSSTVINISSISGMVKSAQHHFSYNASVSLLPIHPPDLLQKREKPNGICPRQNRKRPPSTSTACSRPRSRSKASRSASTPSLPACSRPR